MIEIIFTLYLLLIILIGILSNKFVSSQLDFLLAGRRLGPWVTAFSERASGESAWLIIGLPGSALVAGLLEIWTVMGCIGGIMFSWLIIALLTKYSSLASIISLLILSLSIYS